jgi:hypothetical protein
MAMKTQPEIDAVFLASYGASDRPNSPADLHMLITCEAKQTGQRILEDQIREQVAMAMRITKTIKTPKINAVKPVALQLVDSDQPHRKKERLIYIVEFAHIDRTVFERRWGARSELIERIYSMPLDVVSKTIYRLIPPIVGINA